MKNTVRAAVVPAAGAAVEVREFPRPELEDGAALMRTTFSEVCGTDLHLQQGLLAETPYPLIPGHANVGVVEEVRGRVVDVDGEPLTGGERVTFLDVHGTCGSCWHCLVAKATTRCSPGAKPTRDKRPGSCRPEQAVRSSGNSQDGVSSSHRFTQRSSNLQAQDH